MAMDRARSAATASSAAPWPSPVRVCGDAEPERAAAAAVNTPVPFGPWQIAAGFDSIWVSEMHGGRILRLDPESGAVTATVDVGEQPFKLQPADGRIWARLESRYVAIDPESNTIVAELAKADVGPDADRSWAVDGAMWICDGQRLHRYDPTTSSQSPSSSSASTAGRCTRRRAGGRVELQRGRG